ncbi:hypothetical protein BDW74DRAFT_100390 [Aspergillus multicolor]
MVGDHMRIPAVVCFLFLAHPSFLNLSCSSFINIHLLSQGLLWSIKMFTENRWVHISWLHQILVTWASPDSQNSCERGNGVGGPTNIGVVVHEGRGRKKGCFAP